MYSVPIPVLRLLEEADKNFFRQHRNENFGAHEDGNQNQKRIH
jgi:hypothetical protein